MKKYKVQLTEQHMAQGYNYYPHIVNICIYAGETSPYPYFLVFEESLKNISLAHELKLEPTYFGRSADLIRRRDKDIRRRRRVGPDAEAEPEKRVFELAEEPAEISGENLRKSIIAQMNSWPQPYP